MAFVNGIDVSDFQGTQIDWGRVKNSGYSFAVTKATQSTDNVQQSFAHNIAGIRAAGMVAGAYHFLSWHTPPAAQAANFLSVYQPRNGDLPPALDCEACDVGPQAAIAQIAGFLQAVEPHLGGARMLLYMSFSFPDGNLNGGSDFSGHPLWVAAYNNDPAPPVPAAWNAGNVVMWQYSDGQIPQAQPAIDGLGVNVDRDRFVGDLDALHAFTLKNV
jgi:lysozyme